MIRYRYQSEPSNLGDILRPIADVIIEYKNTRIEASMYIDSGADITMIPFKLGNALGFRKLPKDKILEIKGVSGGGVPYIVKRVNILLDNKKLKIRIAWALIEEVPLLLGRMDVFNKFKIVFEEKLGYVDFLEGNK